MVKGLLEITDVLKLDGNLMFYCISMFKVDGLSLLTACLKHWLSAEKRCPKVLVSTHFHSIIQQKLLPLTSLLSFQVGKLLCKATVIRDVTRTLIGGGGVYIHIFIFCPTSFFSSQIQISQIEKKSVGQNMHI